ncbi:hypothetical protein Sango_3050800 [Sesamum angolense]|uniref:Uncharacterized protein n=1 Tax=Sesamum angolense TaxID=2727404 RepID=A0AAE1W0M3_9LAMI|nr:hypothetical protein Sango_3050800 [Sesamum angolense]
MADTVSHKLVEEYVAALTAVESDFLDQNQESSRMDAGYLKLVEQVLSGLVRKYWLDSGLLYAKGGGVFVPMGTLRHRLLRETHDPQWARHPGIDRMERKKEVGLLQTINDSRVVVYHFFKYGIFIVAPHASPAETKIALFNMMGTELKFSTANHPQTDGQTERVNALVEYYLRDYVGEPAKQQPTTSHEISLQKTGGKCPVAFRFARSKQELLDEAKDNLAKAQRRMKKYADMGRRHVEFSVGDQVLLKLTPQIWKKISSKSVHRGLIPKYDRPFKEKLDEHWEVREACALGPRIMSAWSDIVMDSQTDGQSGCQAVVCTGRHAAHNGRTGLAVARAELGSMALHLAAVWAGRRAAHSGQTGLADARAELHSVA